MLTIKENELNFFIWRIQSDLNLIPIVVTDGGKIKAQTSLSRRIYWWIFFLLEVTYVGYIFVRLVQSLAHPKRYMTELHFPCHLCCCLWFILSLYRGYISFVSHREASIAVFNQLFHDQKSETARKWPEYNRQELFILFDSIVVFSLWFGMLILFIMDGNQLQLLFSVLPGDHQGTITFTITFIIDQILIAGIFTVQFYTENSELLLYLYCESTCSKLIGQLSGWKGIIPAGIPLKALAELKKLTLMLRLFNTVHADAMFYTKLFYMSQATSISFFAIKLFKTNVLVSTIYILFATDLAVIYCVMYERAGNIPSRIKELKARILFVAERIPPSQVSQKVLVKKEVQGIRNVGVQVGNFRTLERISTPLFVDFVVGQVAALLMAFKYKQAVFKT